MSRGPRTPAALACVALLALSCATTPGSAPPAESAMPASNLARLDSAMPQQVGGFTLVDRRRVPGAAAGDMVYRYRDSSSIPVSVYLYPAAYAGPEVRGDPRERVDSEGRVFLATLPIQVQRGIYDSFETLIARPESLAIGGVIVPGFVTGARVHRRGATAHELQLLHLIGGDFVKMRATMPTMSHASVVRTLDSSIVARLVRP